MAIRINYQDNTLEMDAHASAPAAPAAGSVVLYAKPDGFLYSKDETDAESSVSGGSGGGGLTTINTESLSANKTLTDTSEDIHVLTPTVPGLVVFLPDATTLTIQAPRYYIVNNGVYDLEIRNNGNVTIATLLASGNMYVNLLSTSTADGSWRFGGSVTSPFSTVAPTNPVTADAATGFETVHFSVNRLTTNGFSSFFSRSSASPSTANGVYVDSIAVTGDPETIPATSPTQVTGSPLGSSTTAITFYDSQPVSGSSQVVAATHNTGGVQHRVYLHNAEASALSAGVIGSTSDVMSDVSVAVTPDASIVFVDRLFTSSGSPTRTATRFNAGTIALLALWTPGSSPAIPVSGIGSVRVAGLSGTTSAHLSFNSGTLSCQYTDWGGFSAGTNTSIQTGASYGAWKVMGLSSSAALVVFSDQNDSGRGKAYVVTFSGTVPTKNTEYQFESSSINEITLTRIDGSTIMVGYRRTTSGTHGFVCMLSVSGTVVTAGNPIEGTDVAAPGWQPIYRDGVKFAGAYLEGTTLKYRLFP